MPPASLENASMSVTQSTQGQNYETSLSMTKKPSTISTPPPGDDTVEFRKKTRTVGYLWRSGVAGGMAGCAVWLYLFAFSVLFFFFLPP